MEWKEKEIQILEGVRQLMREGKDLATVKMEEISKSAGLGKGTLYLYFSSKEEVLRGALAYTIQMQAEALYQAISGKDFCQAARLALRRIRELADTEGAALRLMFTALERLPAGNGEKSAYLNLESVRLLERVMEELVQKGVSQGLFPPPEDPAYLRQCLLGTAAGFISAPGCPVLPALCPAGQAEDNALKMLLRALNP